MTLTPSEQHQIIAAVHPERLAEVKTNITYLQLMTAMWIGGAAWTVKDCPDFEDVRAIVLSDDESIPNDLHGYDEAKLRALVNRYDDDPESYDKEVERAAVAWLWDTMKLSGSTESTPLPDGLLDAV